MSAWVRPTTRWALYLRGDLRCCYCGVTVQEVIADGDSNFLTLDHVRPLKPMKGQPPGDNHPSNLVACCYACNVDKGRLSLRRWCREGGADYRKVRALAYRQRSLDPESYRYAARMLLGQTDVFGFESPADFVIDHDWLVKRQWGNGGIDGQYWEHLRGQQTLLCPTCNRPEADLEPVPF